MDAPKTGLYFGTFNPIHIGHIAIAGHFANCTDLKEVWLVVSPQNPLKEKASMLAAHHRRELVRIAVEEHSRLKMCDIEFHLPAPSYTINTLTYLRERYPEKKFVLIMGSDNLATLKKWKNYEEILKYAEVYVYPRPGYDGGELSRHPAVKIMEAPLMEISATFIRNAIAEKKNAGHLLPEKVWNYIREMHFYEKKTKS